MSEVLICVRVAPPADSRSLNAAEVGCDKDVSKGVAAMTMAETRRDERVRSFLRARILYNNNSSTIDCTIKNISASGAKIEMSSALAVPNEFDLDVPQKGRIYRARLMWRDSSSIGVQFIDKAAADPEQLGSQAVQLERENKKLKATIAILTKRLESLGQDVSRDDI